MEAFNGTIDYLESVLNDEVDEKKILELSGYSYAMFRRIFSILTDTTLSEYIRARKLTYCAQELRETDKKIIDIALEFGYDSPDSFGLAFKNFHGYTPSEVRKGKPFRITTRIRLALTVKGGNEMKIKVETKGAFKVAGVNRNAIENVDCPKVWDELFGRYSHEELSKLGSGQSFGMCHTMMQLYPEGDVFQHSSGSQLINYMACYDVRDSDDAQKRDHVENSENLEHPENLGNVNNIEKAKQMGLEIMEITEAQYAVVELEGKIPDCIHEGWKYLFEVFFPQHGYMHSSAPDFEVYGEGDMYRDDYKMQLWVPIIKEVQ